VFFSEVVGQEDIKAKLIASVKAGRMPHTQMFYGPDGCGTLPLAIAYAQYIACLNRGEADSCGTCASCQKFVRLIHPDLHFVFPVNTSDKISKDPVSDDYISEWRAFVLTNPYFFANQWYNHIGILNKQGIISRNESESIIRKLNLKSFESEYKILIIWLAEKMNSTSANMLLKLIEEPPEKTIFLMICEDPEQLLVTISSRAQNVKLSGIAGEAMKRALSAKFELKPDELQKISRLANGSYSKALELIESSSENEFHLAKFSELMRLCYSENFLQLNTWVEEMVGLGREKLKSFFEYSLGMVRENFILNLKNPEIIYLNEDEADFSKRFHPFIHGKNVVKICEEMNNASNDIERNANAKIVLFDFSLRLTKIIH
jgi:DNA polymerase III subunit delta'